MSIFAFLILGLNMSTGDMLFVCLTFVGATMASYDCHLGRLLPLLLLLLVAVAAADTNSSDVLMDKDGHWRNEFPELFKATGARPPAWSKDNRRAEGYAASISGTICPA